MKLFLDDYRNPADCLGYMYKRIGDLNPIYAEEWLISRNYPEFIKQLDEHMGMITHVSFDHDLADGHYHKNMQEGKLDYKGADFESDDYNKTGYHAAVYMQNLYEQFGLDLPTVFVHSMNPVGTENITQLLKLPGYTRQHF